MSGRVAFAMNCSSPRSLVNELLRSPTFPSGFGLSGLLGLLGSSGIATGLHRSSPSFLRIDSIYLFCEMAIESLFNVISMPTILDGSPRSVTSHSAFISDFILFISLIVVANSNRSSTQTVMIAKSSPRRQMYAHGSDLRRAYPRLLNFVSRSMFHLHPAWLRPHKAFTSRHPSQVPSA